MKTKFIKLFEQYTREGKFYLSIDEYEKIFKNDIFLKEGKLEGLKGITSNQHIVEQLGSICDVFIEMEENQVLKYNKLIKVDYSNADLLVKNNFQLLKRIMGSGMSLSTPQHFIETIFTNHQDLNYLYEMDNNLGLFLRSSVIVMLKKNVPNINSIDDICNWILTEYDENFNYIHKTISDYITHLVVKYKDEEEWIILDKYFTVPPKSKIYIDLYCIEDNVGEENIKEAKHLIEKVTKEFLSNYEVIEGTFAETEI